MWERERVLRYKRINRYIQTKRIFDNKICKWIYFTGILYIYIYIYIYIYWQIHIYIYIYIYIFHCSVCYPRFYALRVLSDECLKHETQVLGTTLQYIYIYIYSERWGVRCAVVIVVENRYGEQCSNPGRDCISQSINTNTLEEVINPIILPQVIGKYLDRLGFSTLVWQPVSEKEN